MRENSSHRARDADLRSSTDEEEQVTSRNAKKAHRKRSGRSKKFNESLKMAKLAKIELVGIHNIGTTKKVFELNHDGKSRLTEIGETVSCNCSFARGSDICLHVIWVMTNVLRVNENDERLHQKSHSRQVVTEMLQKCSSTKTTDDVHVQSKSTSTVSTSTTAQHPQLKTKPTTVATQIEQTRILPSQQTSRENVKLPYPSPRVGQYIITSLKYCHPQVLKCFGCS